MMDTPISPEEIRKRTIELNTLIANVKADLEAGNQEKAIISISTLIGDARSLIHRVISSLKRNNHANE